MRRVGPGLFFGAMAVAACTALLVSDAEFADAAPLPNDKVCSDTTRCDLLRQPDRRVLPAGVMFARASFTETATDALAGRGDRKDKRVARREARKERRAARRAKRKEPSAS